MATFEFLLENTVLERGRAEVEADSLDEAMELMRRKIDDGDYEASWNYAETLSCRILEVEDAHGLRFDFSHEEEWLPAAVPRTS